MHGTDAYAEAVERTLEVTREGAEEIRAPPELELVAEPELCVLAFRRHGWDEDDYHAWAERLRDGGHRVRAPDDGARARPSRGSRS